MQRNYRTRYFTDSGIIGQKGFVTRGQLLVVKKSIKNLKSWIENRH